MPRSASDDLADFLDYLASTVGDRTARARSAPEAGELAELLDAMQRPLPALYAAYLRYFGEGDGALKMADDADARVSKLLALYREQDAGETVVPAHGVIIGAWGVSGERALLYPHDSHDDALGMRAATEPAVVISWWGKVDHVCARSFRNHIYRQAFVRGRLRDGVRCNMWRDDPAFYGEVCGHLMTLGFAPTWFSDDRQCCMERDDGSLFYLFRTNQRTSLYGALATEHARHKIENDLLSRFDLRDHAAH